MHRKKNARATRTRFRNFLCASLVSLALGGSLAWRGTPALLANPHDVPFRFMESTILETQAALEAGTITSEQLVRMYLARITVYDKQGPAINAMIRLNPNAIAEARALDADRRSNTKKLRGPLYGIPMVLKENYDTFDMPTTAASLSLATSVPPDDAYLTRRLREAGAIFVGKTNMHEFAFGITTISSLGGQTLNPYDLTRNPGGSSGGTGAGISANFATVGMGSDTCGSIRIPSSHNSLTGLRVTQNLFSRDGIIPLSLTQDVGGPLARDVTDLAVVLDATAGFDPNDPATEVSIGHTPSSYRDFLQTGKLQGARFGLMTDVLVTTPADQEVANVILAAANELAGLGATVVNVAIPDFTNVSNTSVINFEFAENLNAYSRGHAEGAVQDAAGHLQLGSLSPVAGRCTDVRAQQQHQLPDLRRASAGSRRVQAGAREGDGRQPPRRPDLSDDPAEADPRSEHEPTGQQLQGERAVGSPRDLRASGIHAGRRPGWTTDSGRDGIPRPGVHGRRSSRPRVFVGTGHPPPPAAGRERPGDSTGMVCTVSPTALRRSSSTRQGSRCASQRRTPRRTRTSTRA